LSARASFAVDSSNNERTVGGAQPPASVEFDNRLSRELILPSPDFSVDCRIDAGAF
jgi:hypothetical protein